MQAQKADEEDHPDDFPEDADRHSAGEVDMEASRINLSLQLNPKP